VTRIEERLCDAFAATTATIGPEQTRGLPSRPPARRTSARWRQLAPLAAAAAVAAVIAAVFVLAPLAFRGHQRRATLTPPPPAAANGKMAFARGALGSHGQLWTVNPDGSGLRKLTDLPGVSLYPSWSPDGKRLVFADVARFVRPPSPPSWQWSLYTINKNGTGLRRLTVCRRPGCLQDYEPAWSPAGSQIAFVRNQDIYLIDANGTGLRRLTHAATPLGAGQPAWSPDSRKLAFVVFRAGPAKRPAIYVMNADGTHVRRLTDCQSECLDSEPAWSPDGTTIAFTRNSDVYAMSPDGRGVTRLTDCARIAGCVSAGGPVWSPDGREIVFWVEGRDSIRQPYIMNADGSDVRSFIPKTSDICCLAWQPRPARS
jgi:TolB protein